MKIANETSTWLFASWAFIYDRPGFPGIDNPGAAVALVTDKKKTRPLIKYIKVREKVLKMTSKHLYPNLE
uniref:Uncharacterized protein n=1 Tax=Steinernema glaseri TaxID=37863 RepID=A0A1I8AGR5_9BILA